MPHIDVPSGPARVSGPGMAQVTVVCPQHNVGPLKPTLLQVLIQALRGVYHVFIPVVLHQLIPAQDQNRAGGVYSICTSVMLV